MRDYPGNKLFKMWASVPWRISQIDAKMSWLRRMASLFSTDSEFSHSTRRLMEEREIIQEYQSRVDRIIGMMPGPYMQKIVRRYYLDHLTTEAISRELFLTSGVCAHYLKDAGYIARIAMESMEKVAGIGCGALMEEEYGSPSED